MEFNEKLITKKIHSDESGGYTEQRKELHTEIIKKMFGDTNNQQIENVTDAVILGGGSNSGKSFMINSLPDDLFLIDPDEIKEFIPEYEDLKKDHPELAAGYVHDESSDISNSLLKKAINLGIALIYDGTMSNIEKYQDILKDLKEKDYFITLLIVDVPVELAIERNKVRFLETGRMVPESILRKTHKAVPASFISLKEYADEYYLYDTSKKNPILIAEKQQGEEEKIYEPELLKAFLKKRY
ncbi:putative minor head protein [uncultured Caudovirales phage]|uniref:Putative minor head protein n=1 Tax=uncultured Caudovirales phage TaxID=2100421 RepID=A0A2H4J4U1_9CAUD|nr:putative minor head protein [uncultured Caudovirales phage]